MTGFDWVLLGFTGFYWVLLGFTGFYWVSPIRNERKTHSFRFERSIARFCTIASRFLWRKNKEKIGRKKTNEKKTRATNDRSTIRRQRHFNQDGRTQTHTHKKEEKNRVKNYDGPSHWNAKPKKKKKKEINRPVVSALVYGDVSTTTTTTATKEEKEKEKRKKADLIKMYLKKKEAKGKEGRRMQIRIRRSRTLEVVKRIPFFSFFLLDRVVVVVVVVFLISDK